VNLLGAAGYSGAPTIQGLTPSLTQPGVCFHWYGKKETRPQRKMGHVTVLDLDLDAASARASAVRDQLQIVGEHHV